MNNATKDTMRFISRVTNPDGPMYSQVDMDAALAAARQEEREAFHGAVTEISAGRVLVPKTDADKAWNDSAARCMEIVRGYIDGEGLFQMTKDAIRRRTP